MLFRKVRVFNFKICFSLLFFRLYRLKSPTYLGTYFFTQPKKLQETVKMQNAHSSENVYFKLIFENNRKFTHLVSQQNLNHKYAGF